MSDEILQKAVDLYKINEKKQAQKLLIDIIKKEPKNASAWYGLALCTDDQEKRVYYLRKVLEIKPNHIKAELALDRINNDSNMLFPKKVSKTIEKPGILNSNLDELKTSHEDANQENINFIQSTKETQTMLELLQSETKKCPYCGENIKTEAIVCRFCGSELYNKKSRTNNFHSTTSSAGIIIGGISIFFGIVGLLVFGIPFGILSIIFGIIAIVIGSKSGIAGIILGIIDIVFALVALYSLYNSYIW